MTLFALVVYGVGDMVGTGIYATIGKAAGTMGNATWLAFVMSMVAAMLTGLSYACLASRYPRAAGAAFVTHHAFRWSYLSYLVGLAVTCSGLTSMASGANAFAGAMHDNFLPAVDSRIIIVGYLGAIAALNFWGIRESMWGNLICTLVEVGGIVLVIFVGMRFWGSVNYLETPLSSTDAHGTFHSGLSASLLLSGAVLTFFSFVGFEDMLNVAEEVKNPRRNMPLGIIIALCITTVLYISVAVTAVSVVPYTELGKAGAPMEAVMKQAAPWLPNGTYAFITMFAVANSGLINYIMGSRMLYGMSRQRMLPGVLSAVHEKRRTPHVAIAVLFVAVVVLALTGNVQDLGSATALLLLGCFSIVNIGLVVLKFRKSEPRGNFEVHFIIPLLGSMVCIAMIVGRMLPNKAGMIDWNAPRIALIIGGCITALYFILKPKSVVVDEINETD